MRPTLPLLPLVLALLLAPMLGGCRYNFVPVIPREVPFELPVRLTKASLQRLDTGLEVKATLEGQVKAGYLSVVWFDGDHELGRDSVYLDAQQRQARFVFQAPNKGDYRAMLLFDGELLRQLNLNEVGSF